MESCRAERGEVKCVEWGVECGEQRVEGEEESGVERAVNSGVASGVESGVRTVESAVSCGEWDVQSGEWGPECGKWSVETTDGSIFVVRSACRVVCGGFHLRALCVASPHSALWTPIMFPVPYTRNRGVQEPESESRQDVRFLIWFKSFFSAAWHNNKELLARQRQKHRNARNVKKHAYFMIIFKHYSQVRTTRTITTVSSAYFIPVSSRSI